MPVFSCGSETVYVSQEGKGKGKVDEKKWGGGLGRLPFLRIDFTSVVEGAKASDDILTIPNGLW